MSRVWSVHPTKDDLTAALAYGELVTVTKGYLFGDEVDDEQLPAGLIAILDAAAERFDFAEDFLLINGDQLQFATFVTMLARRRWEALHQSDTFIPPIRMLRWDRQALGYFVVKLP